MMEMFLSAGVFGIVATLAITRVLVAPFALLTSGVTLTALGSVLSAVGGAGYHVALYATLGRRGVLGRNWVWQPTSYHRRLTSRERARVLPWFVFGATGFGLVIVGGLVVLASGWREGAG